MEQEPRRGATTVTLRLRRGLYREETLRGGKRFILGDSPDHSEPTVIRIAVGDDGRLSELEIKRKAHSYFPVYVHRTWRGEVVIADTMGFMHDVVRREGLELKTEAQLDHLLFGRSPETGLVKGIEVVDHGEYVRFQRCDGEWKLEERGRWDRFEQRREGHWRREMAVLSHCLEEAVASIRPSSIMFSGGVDSTLLRTMLDDDVEMISGRVELEEFLPEVEQARRAAALFGGEHRLVDVDHGEYVEQLVDLTVTTGLPCPAMQHVLQTRVAAQAESPVVYGELGDGMFGLPTVEDAGLQVLVSNAPCDEAGVASRVFSLASWRSEDHSFDDDLEAFYGPTAGAHRRRSRRVADLLDWLTLWEEGEGSWERFLTSGHVTDYLTAGCIKSVRDFASSQGLVVHTPLTDRSLIDEFHRCDPKTRYRDGGRTKPVLKELLWRRLPAYVVDRPKLASGLPRTWYFTEGPLSGVFDRFAPPEPMAQAVGRAIDNPQWANSWILWPALSYSVWYHRWFDSEVVPERGDMVVYRWSEGKSEAVRAAS